LADLVSAFFAVLIINAVLYDVLQSALSSLEDMKQAVNSGQTVTDRTHRERSCPSQKKQFLLDRHVSFSCSLQFSLIVPINQNLSTVIS